MSDESAPPVEATKKRTILESFGRHTSPFTCADCGNDRRYYDLLSDNTMLCLECSTKGEYEPDIHVAVNVRDPGLMLRDPELIDVRKALVHWNLAKGSVPLGEVHIPKSLAEELIDIAKKERSSLDVLVTTALSMMMQTYQREAKEAKSSG